MCQSLCMCKGKTLNITYFEPGSSPGLWYDFQSLTLGLLWWISQSRSNARHPTQGAGPPEHLIFFLLQVSQALAVLVPVFGWRREVSRLVFLRLTPMVFIDTVFYDQVPDDVGPKDVIARLKWSLSECIVHYLVFVIWSQLWIAMSIYLFSTLFANSFPP